MFKKYIAIPALLLAVVAALSGCFGFGGYGAAQPTNPPEKEYKSAQEFADAVAAAKADTQAADEADLKGLTGYYVPQALPDGATLSYIKASTVCVRFGYTFGPTVEGSFDNRMEIAFYRNVKSSDFLSQIANSTPNYDTVSAGGIDYLHVVPDINLIVTPSPGDPTPAATPTPITQKYCQFVYWVQGETCFMCALPLGFTKDDIAKYCQGVRVELS